MRLTVACFVRVESAYTVATVWRGAQQRRDLDADRIPASTHEVYDLDPSDPAQLDQLRRSTCDRNGVEEQGQNDGVDREVDIDVTAGL